MSANNKHLLGRKDVWNTAQSARVSQASKAASRGQAVDLLTPDDPATPTLESLQKKRAEITDKIMSIDQRLAEFNTTRDRSSPERARLVAAKTLLLPHLKDVNAKLRELHFASQNDDSGRKIDWGSVAVEVLREVRHLRREIAELRRSLGVLDEFESGGSRGGGAPPDTRIGERH